MYLLQHRAEEERLQREHEERLREIERKMEETKAKYAQGYCV